MTFSIRLTEKEKEIAESYAELYSISLEEAFKQALFEKIEDACDLIAFDDAFEEYQQSGRQSRPINELWNELDLD